MTRTKANGSLAGAPAVVRNDPDLKAAWMAAEAAQGDDYVQARALLSLVKTLAGSGYFKEARAVLRRIRKNDLKADGSCAIFSARSTWGIVNDKPITEPAKRALADSDKRLEKTRERSCTR